jgi:hypothetical protein
MRIKEFYEADDLDFDAGIDSDDDYGSETNFKQEAIQAQLMKISDSEESDDIKNPVRTVKTDDGDVIRVEHGEAVAMLKMLQSPLKPAKKLEIQRHIQNTDGFNEFLEFVKKSGMVK